LFSFGLDAGTGFFVSKAGDIVTARHVVQGCRLVRVAGYGFEGQVANLVALDADNDLALLRVAIASPASLMIADGTWGNSKEVIQDSLDRADFGQGKLIGYPGSSVSMVSSNVVLPPLILQEDSKYYRVVNGLISDGLSGGPVLYQTGEVAGVLIQSDLDQWHMRTTGGWESKVGLFVPGPVVEGFLKAAEIVGEGAGDPTKAIVHIFCFTGLPNL